MFAIKDSPKVLLINILCLRMMMRTDTTAFPVATMCVETVWEG